MLKNSKASCYKATIISHDSTVQIIVGCLLCSISKKYIRKVTALTFQSFKYISTYTTGINNVWNSNGKASHNMSPLSLKFLNHVFHLFSRLKLSDWVWESHSFSWSDRREDDAELTSFPSLHSPLTD